jgi:hypothetical protein
MWDGTPDTAPTWAICDQRLEGIIKKHTFTIHQAELSAKLSAKHKPQHKTFQSHGLNA